MRTQRAQQEEQQVSAGLENPWGLSPSPCPLCASSTLPFLFEQIRSGMRCSFCASLWFPHPLSEHTRDEATAWGCGLCSSPGTSRKTSFGCGFYNGLVQAPSKPQRGCGFLESIKQRESCSGEPWVQLWPERWVLSSQLLPRKPLQPIPFVL